MGLDAQSPVVVDPSARGEARAVRVLDVAADDLLFFGVRSGLRVRNKPVGALVDLRRGGNVGAGRSVARLIGCRSATGKRKGENGESDDSDDDKKSLPRRSARSGPASHFGESAKYAPT